MPIAVQALKLWTVTAYGREQPYMERKWKNYGTGKEIQIRRAGI